MDLGLQLHPYKLHHFDLYTNAVIPRPNWPASDADVPISTTPPLNESSLGALDWDLWKNIGEEFLIKSNINNWLVCQPKIGSISPRIKEPSVVRI